MNILITQKNVWLNTIFILTKDIKKFKKNKLIKFLMQRILNYEKKLKTKKQNKDLFRNISTSVFKIINKKKLSVAVITSP